MWLEIVDEKYKHCQANWIEYLSMLLFQLTLILINTSFTFSAVYLILESETALLSGNMCLV